MSSTTSGYCKIAQKVTKEEKNLENPVPIERETEVPYGARTVVSYK
jgi:hypothetical protein